MISNSSGYRIWLLALVVPIPFGRTIAGALIFLLWFSVANVWSDADEISLLAKLFAAGMIAYIVPVFGYIIERSEAAFDEIEHLLDATAEERDQWRRALSHRSTTWFLAVGVLSASMAAGNIALMEGYDGWDIQSALGASRSHLLTYWGTLLIWMTMTTAVAALLDNARLFAQLSKRLRIDVLCCPALLSVSSVAIVSTLSIICAQTLFVLLVLDSQTGWQMFLPGFITTTMPTMALFLIPIWPLHKRLQAVRREELSKVNLQLEETRSVELDLNNAASLDQVNQLLLYRSELDRASEWPFNIRALTLFGLYLVFPPLTWVGAAIIEKLVNSLL